MGRQLGGWWRLWIAASFVWAMVVAGLGYLSWPSIENVPHSDKFISRLSTASLSILGGGEPIKTWPAISSERPPWERYQLIVQQPNGYDMAFPMETTEDQAIQVSAEYTGILREAVEQERRSSLLKWMTLWVGPVLLVMLLGLTVRWIDDGFRSTRKRA